MDLSGEAVLTEKQEVRYTKGDINMLKQIATKYRCSIPDVIRRACVELFEAEAKKDPGINGETRRQDVKASLSSP